MCNRKCGLTLAGVILSAIWASPALAGPPAGYKLAFADEFNGTSLDTYKWDYNYPWGPTHNHAAYMSPSQVKFTGTGNDANGSLNLQAVKQRNPAAKDFYDGTFGWQVMDYTSGAINSANTFRANSGYFEAAIKQPSQMGTWPAFWMLKDGWPPEIDIMEYYRNGDTNGTRDSRYRYVANFHYTNNAGANASYYNNYWTSADLSAAYHTYGLGWTATSMEWYLDGVKIHSTYDATAIADAQNMYMILNHAVGGWAGAPPAGTVFPADYLVDYVRVYQAPGASLTTTWSTTTSNTSWDAASNWSTQVPKLGDVQAIFGNNANAAQNITWNKSHPVGSLRFDSTTTAYTIGSGAGSLQLAVSSGNAGISVASTNTVNQAISSRLDLWSSVTITNDSATTLTLLGQIVSNGGITFQGAGTTLVSNNNTYTGDTTIDAGQNAVVVRIDRSRPFGTVGTLKIGPIGNATTARLELTAGREVPNPINFHGRNNSSVSIENISGNNILSGTLSVQTGGANYIIQSDAGLLTLNGQAAGANGIALQSAATGSRTVTFQGAGNGEVTGAIQNGNAIVSLVKAGAGQWKTTASNTYTGTTTVSGGVLLLNGSHTGGGSYTVSSSATLAGTGTIDPAPSATMSITGGAVSPGNPGLVGTLTIGSSSSPNNVSFSGGELDIHLAANGVCDLLAINGGLSLSPTTALRLYGPDDNSYTSFAQIFLTFTPNTLGTGRFGAIYWNDVLVSNGTGYVGNSYSIFYSDANGTIALAQMSPVPEPTTLSLLAAASLLTLRRPRTRRD